jgi:hypothetical protein
MSAFAIAVEGMYANPEYGGNRPPMIAPGNPSGGATGFLDPMQPPDRLDQRVLRGDTQPHGYTTFVPDGPPDANGSAPGHYVETPGHPMSTATRRRSRSRSMRATLGRDPGRALRTSGSLGGGKRRDGDEAGDRDRQRRGRLDGRARARAAPASSRSRSSRRAPTTSRT